MKIDEAKDYIQSIGEWVLDEDKIVSHRESNIDYIENNFWSLQVTYKWLSKTLSVHVNTAKQ